jgi:cell pole-organizing protein PopZ
MDEFSRLGSKLYEDVQELPIGNGAVTLEGLVRELVRPMLKEWLDQHLPITVERLVREEIERLVMQSQRKDPW